MLQSIPTTAAYKAAEVYEQYFVTSMFRYWTPRLLERAAPQPGERVLDVACGTGVVARSIVPLVGNQGKVVGLDINPAMLEVACKQYSEYCEDIDWQEGRAEDIPFPAQSFDLLTCQQGLQFFKDQPKAAREMYRVLRPQGRAVIAVWQSSEHNPVHRAVFETIASVFHVPVSDLVAPFSFGDPRKFENLLVEAGFQQVRVESVRQDVHFREPSRFVELTVKGAAAVMPAFAELDGKMQSELLSEVHQKTAPLINSHTRDGILTFPMEANLAVGVRS